MDREKAIEMYQSGGTLSDVSEYFGVSRQAVHKMLKRAGVDPKSGGISKRREHTLGCSLAEAMVLNKGKNYNHPPMCDYFHQRYSAAQRGISWEITFPEWMEVWTKSGKLKQRGVHGYCMARKADVGPYSKDNVYITPFGQNTQDYYLAMGSERLKRFVVNQAKRKRK